MIVVNDPLPRRRGWAAGTRSTSLPGSPARTPVTTRWLTCARLGRIVGPTPLIPALFARSVPVYQIALVAFYDVASLVHQSLPP